MNRNVLKWSTIPAALLICISVALRVANAVTVILSPSGSVTSISPNIILVGTEKTTNWSGSVSTPQPIDPEAKMGPPGWSLVLDSAQYKLTTNGAYIDANGYQVVIVPTGGGTHSSGTVSIKPMTPGYWKFVFHVHVQFGDTLGNGYIGDSSPSTINLTAFSATISVPSGGELAAHTGWDGTRIDTNMHTPDIETYAYIQIIYVPSDISPKPNVQLTVDKLSGAGYSAPPSYTPPDKGSVSYILDGKWRYDSFTEPQSQKHPGNAILAWIKGQYSGQDIGSPVAIRVDPVFYYLTNSVTRSDGSTEGADFYAAAGYAAWKYSVPHGVGGNWYVDLSVASYGETNPTPFAPWDRDTYLYELAFQDENTCASTIGHETVHRNQSLYVLQQSSFYTDGKKYAEGQAYDWEHDHFSDTGLSPLEQAQVNEWLAWCNDTTGTVAEP